MKTAAFLSQYVQNVDQGKESAQAGHGSEQQRVGVLLCIIFDRDGRLIDHPLNQRVMSAPLEAVREAPVRVLAAGGAQKLAAIEGAIRLLKPTTLVTDEATARRLSGGGRQA